MSRYEPLRFDEREIISRELSRDPDCSSRFIGRLLGRTPFDDRPGNRAQWWCGRIPCCRGAASSRPESPAPEGTEAGIFSPAARCGDGTGLVLVGGAVLVASGRAVMARIAKSAGSDGSRHGRCWLWIEYLEYAIGEPSMPHARTRTNFANDSSVSKRS